MSPRHTAFKETMEGTIRIAGEDEDRPIRLDLTVRLPELLRPRSDVEGPMSGRVHVPGWADDTGASGTLHVAPLTARRIRYRLAFTAADGRCLRFDGWKSVDLRHPLRTMTTLPATITDEDGVVVGEARLRFWIRRDLLRMLASFRLPRAKTTQAAQAIGDLFQSRWRGQAGRLEVWYTTLTDPATGTGVWIHHELVAPSDGGTAREHGWAAVFPKGEPPALARFTPAAEPAPGAVFASADIELTPEHLRGEAGTLSWDLRSDGSAQAPIFTFPRWAWERELLPAAQIVPAPGEVFNGTIRYGDSVLELVDAPGATARIYGHGNAKRWAWLHADLGGGDVCEVVAAVSTRPGLDRLPPLPFVRLRVDGAEWPRTGPLLAAARLRAKIDLPTWSVRGRIGGRLLHIEVTQPPEATIAVDYEDPDGVPAVCHNSERSSAVITLSRRNGAGWKPEREWRLDGTAHAEVGLR